MVSALPMVKKARPKTKKHPNLAEIYFSNETDSVSD